jgi:methyl-accepting chemotaxis protein
MIKNMTIRTKLFTGFGAVMLLAGIVSVTAYISISTLRGNIQELGSKRLVQVATLGDLTKNIITATSYLQAASIADNKENMDKAISTMLNTRKAITDDFDKLKALVQSEKGKSLLQALTDKRKPAAEMRDQVVTLLKDGKRKEALAMLDKFMPVQAAYVSAAEDLGTFVREQANAINASADSNSKTAGMIIVIFSVIATGIAVLVALWVIRSITRPLTQAVNTANQLAVGNLDVKVEVQGNDELSELLKALDKLIVSYNTTLSKILATANDTVGAVDTLRNRNEKIKEGAVEQAGQASQIAASAEQMSQTIVDIAKNAAVASETSSEAMETAIKGKEVVDGAVESVNRVHASSEDLSAMIVKLNGRANQIGNIVTVIKDIADQTNLLALNAAIEAARAGDQGRGFAVVADEVRKLAERTIKATADISKEIGAVQADSSETAKSMEGASQDVAHATAYMKQAGDLLNNIVEGVRKVGDQVTQIATAVEEQSAASEEVANSIERTSGIAKEMENMSVETMLEVNNLTKISDELRNATVGFKIRGNELMILDLAKTDHRIFVGKISSCLKGGEKIDPSKLPDHHTCRFGKWYDSDGQSVCGGVPSFKAIEDPHAKIHMLAKEALLACQAGDKSKAKNLFSDMEGLSEKITLLIDTLKSDCMEDRRR